MTEDATGILTKIGKDTSLRYAIQLITSSSIVAQRRKASKVDLPDLHKVFTLFLDEKRSMDYLSAFQEQYMFNEAKPKSTTEASTEQMEQ